MNEQEQQPPLQPEQPATPTPESAPVTPPTPETEEKNKLEQLPPAIKEILDKMVKNGFGSQKIKSDLEHKFGPVGDILPASRGTYQRYIDKHYDRLEQEKKAEDAILQALKEDNEQVIDTADGVLGSDRRSIKDQIEHLKRYCLKRIDVIEKYQGQGIPSSQLENNLSRYVDVVRTLLEKTMEYGEELNKETNNTLATYLEDTIQEWIDTMIDIHKKIYGTDKIVEFSTELKAAMEPVLKAQLLEIERENDEGKR